ncbi:putative tethering factor for nuclear proteasome STS1 isoform X3 [Apostichopus japonicus]|uniref:Putative tethering factor for nuclear proteasome STS1 isoform X3 n=1 Tax=Stichopus japonicus TaxID=307972 RepID=A0A2G8JFN8_STIJA|nr:putative tethering factor for nuclear proteasome STS1 isoform X3 [Apostichopus japonicus]
MGSPTRTSLTELESPCVPRDIPVWYSQRSQETTATACKSGSCQVRRPCIFNSLSFSNFYGQDPPEILPIASSTPISQRPPPLPLKRQLRSSSQSPCKKKLLVSSPVKSEPDVSVDEVLLWIQSCKRQRTSKEPIPGKLEKRLHSLTADQLAAVLEEVVEKHPHLEQDVIKLLPEPDISHHLSQLSDLLHNIYRSLPRQRLCSSRSPFSYRRVKSHIFTFKKFCISQGRHFLACETWQTAVEYSLAAWQQASYLPKWDCPVHNRLKAGCMRGLAGICVEGLSNGTYTLPYLNQLRTSEVKMECRR